MQHKIVCLRNKSGTVISPLIPECAYYKWFLRLVLMCHVCFFAFRLGSGRGRRMEVTCSSGMSDVSSHSPASETNQTTRCSDYSGCHGYHTAGSGATTREATEDECCGDVSSTEVTSERSHRTSTSDLVTAAKSIRGVASRGRFGSNSDASRLPSVETNMSDSDVVQKRRKLTDTGFSEEDEQVSLVICHLVAPVWKSVNLWVCDDSCWLEN